jgi:hypothetical protein
MSVCSRLGFGSGLGTRFVAVGRRSFDRLLILLACLFVGAAMTGCVDTREVESFRLEVVQLRDELRQESEAWEKRLATLEPQDPLEPQVRAALARSRALEAAANAAVEQVDLVLKDAASGPAGQTVQDLSPFIPEPARLPIALGVALAAAIGRSVQLKRGMVSIARGFQKAIEEDPAFQERFRQHANTFRAIQTRAAQRIVDEATSERLVRLPV